MKYKYFEGQEKWHLKYQREIGLLQRVQQHKPTKYC